LETKPNRNAVWKPNHLLPHLLVLLPHLSEKQRLLKHSRHTRGSGSFRAHRSLFSSDGGQVQRAALTGLELRLQGCNLGLKPLQTSPLSLQSHAPHHPPHLSELELQHHAVVQLRGSLLSHRAAKTAPLC
jgi:hypothetical protein